jgi:hypothetical protein
MAWHARNDLIWDTNGVVTKRKLSGERFLREGHCGRLARLRQMEKGSRDGEVNVHKCGASSLDVGRGEMKVRAVRSCDV